MHGIYNYVPATNHVPTVYSAAAVLYLQLVLHVMLFRHYIIIIVAVHDLERLVLLWNFTEMPFIE
jgi:hypothetical protein